MDTQKTTTRHTVVRRAATYRIERETEAGSDNCECSYCHRRRLVADRGQQLFVYFTMEGLSVGQHSGSFCSDVCHDLYHGNDAMSALSQARTLSGRVKRRIDELEADVAHLTWAIAQYHRRGESAMGHTNRKIAKEQQAAMLRKLLDPDTNAKAA